MLRPALRLIATVMLLVIVVAGVACMALAP